MRWPHKGTRKQMERNLILCVGLLRLPGQNPTDGSINFLSFFLTVVETGCVCDSAGNSGFSTGLADGCCSPHVHKAFPPLLLSLPTEGGGEGRERETSSSRCHVLDHSLKGSIGWS